MSNTYFLQSGNEFYPIDKQGMAQSDTLPLGTYIIQAKDDGRLYLKNCKDFSIEGKLYGAIQERTDLVLTTFHDRLDNTGVLLYGNKGSGKTLLAKNIALQSNLPIVLINTMFKGDKFNHFLQSIDQNVVVIFEEFEKIYLKKEDQAEILTILDGVFRSKKLFIFTVNDSHNVHDGLWGRPSRVYYAWEYGSISEEEIKEYCADFLKNESYLPAILDTAKIIENFNFDMLQSLLEEVNRYDITPKDALKRLNIKLVTSRDSMHRYKVTLQLKDTTKKIKNLHPEEISGIPLSRDRIEIGVSVDDTYEDMVFTNLDMQMYDFREGVYRYVNSSGDILTLTQIRTEKRHFFDLL